MVGKRTASVGKEVINLNLKNHPFWGGFVLCITYLHAGSVGGSIIFVLLFSISLLGCGMNSTKSNKKSGVIPVHHILTRAEKEVFLKAIEIRRQKSITNNVRKRRSIISTEK